jgi:hypothetical protein
MLSMYDTWLVGLELQISWGCRVVVPLLRRGCWRLVPICGFAVEYYLIDFYCCLLDFAGCYLGASYSNFLLDDFANQVGPC